MEKEKIQQTLFDQMITDDNAQTLKAVIPYLPGRSRQLLSVYEKLMELQNTMTLFGNTEKEIEMCSMPVSDPVEVLDSIRNVSYGKSRQKLDQIVNMIAMVQMMQIMDQPK